MSDPTIDWTEQLALQLSWHWESQLRPRLDGLTDAEYFWEPVPRAWNVRPRGAGDPRLAVGSGDFTYDLGSGEPDPAPFTTIAWRLGHILVGVLGDRIARHFGGPPADHETFDHPGSARAALDQLDAGYAAWITGVGSLSPTALAAPCGEPGHASDPMAALVLHINRELIHHGAEISLLRDLYPGLTGSSQHVG